jgi:hypothetical protein
VPDRRPGVQSTGADAELGGEDQPDRHRVAVPPAVVLDPLDRVGERVAVVEDLAQPALAQVFADDPRLHTDRALDEFARMVLARLDQVQNHGIGDEAALHDLGHAGGEVPGRKGVEGRQIAEDGGGRVERAHQVLARGGVDAGLSADRGVDHAEQTRRDVHDRDAAQPAGADEPGEVGDRSPADTHDGVGAREPGFPERFPALLGHGDGLAGLGVGHLDRQDRATAVLYDLYGFFGMRRERCREQHGDLRGLPESVGQLGQQVAADEHGVRAVAGDLDGGGHNFSAISSARSSGVRPSVVTVIVATSA